MTQGPKSISSTRMTTVVNVTGVHIQSRRRADPIEITPKLASKKFMRGLRTASVPAGGVGEIGGRWKSLSRSSQSAAIWRCVSVSGWRRRGQQEK